MSPAETIVNLYIEYGDSHYGEELTQTEHAVQCATLAQRAGAPTALIVAALLHDIGHLLDAIDANHGNFQHDRVGGDYLARFFGTAVSEPVRYHAQAKRYLCATEPDYYRSLSPASKFSLDRQGGVMGLGESRSFEQIPYFAAAIALRRWDDRAKDRALISAPITAFQPLLLAILATSAP